MTTPIPTTTEAVTISEAALSFPGPACRPVRVMRPAPDRTAPPSPDSQGLSLREKLELRRQGFTEADVAFLNAEIRNFCEREEAMRRARPPEWAPAARGRQSAIPGWTSSSDPSGSRHFDQTSFNQALARRNSVG